MMILRVQCNVIAAALPLLLRISGRYKLFISKLVNNVNNFLIYLTIIKYKKLHYYLFKHEKILEYTGTYEDYLRKDTDNSFWLVNTNKLVRYYSGVDGLKTGYTETAGYCITTTAKKNNMRLITVVMGEPSSSVRNSETTAMLEYGFNTYQIDTILSKKTVLSKEKVILGKEEYVEIVPKEDINILNKKVGTKRNVTYEVELENVKAPIKKVDSVGKIKVIEENKTIMTIDATVKTNIDKANILTSYYRDLLDILNGSL